jgi:hypothetical protein
MSPGLAAGVEAGMQFAGGGGAASKGPMIEKRRRAQRSRLSWIDNGEFKKVSQCGGAGGASNQE